MINNSIEIAFERYREEESLWEQLFNDMMLYGCSIMYNDGKSNTRTIDPMSEEADEILKQEYIKSNKYTLDPSKVYDRFEKKLLNDK